MIQWFTDSKKHPEVGCFFLLTLQEGAYEQKVDSDGDEQCQETHLSTVCSWRYGRLGLLCHYELRVEEIPVHIILSALK